MRRKKNDEKKLNEQKIYVRHFLTQWNVFLLLFAFCAKKVQELRCVRWTRRKKQIFDCKTTFKNFVPVETRPPIKNVNILFPIISCS